ncbi:tetraspanin 3 [Columba livia]|uniref:Tetraspanin 3 n=1 Tax=Columba livia TaxID=8932 RepID=A0A2I0M6X5_COLLI|nr:tetraspanin 3 [Columba livia]
MTGFPGSYKIRSRNQRGYYTLPSIKETYDYDQELDLMTLHVKHLLKPLTLTSHSGNLCGLRHDGALDKMLEIEPLLPERRVWCSKKRNMFFCLL